MEESARGKRCVFPGCENSNQMGSSVPQCYPHSERNAPHSCLTARSIGARWGTNHQLYIARSTFTFTLLNKT